MQARLVAISVLVPIFICAAAGAETRTVTLALDGRLYLDRAPTDESELAQEMGALGRADPDTAVFVRADKDIRYGRVAGVLKILHDAGLSRVALVTDASEEGGPRRTE